MHGSLGSSKGIWSLQACIVRQLGAGVQVRQHQMGCLRIKVSFWMAPRTIGMGLNNLHLCQLFQYSVKYKVVRKCIGFVGCVGYAKRITCCRSSCIVVHGDAPPTTWLCCALIGMPGHAEFCFDIGLAHSRECAHLHVSQCNVY